MRLVFIGFSGTGKSHWSELLSRELGYHHICCDDIIEEKLKTLLPDDSKGIDAVADWMGQPYDSRFKANQEAYLNCEIEVLQEYLTANASIPEKEVILDTTGSVVYTGDELTSRLSDFGTVVYLEITPSVLDQMFQVFLAHPKPIVWGESFKPNPGESEQDALVRCYRDLLEYRQSRYQSLAEVTLDYNLLRTPGFSAQDFIDEINRVKVAG